jgi:hypothetical protein
MHLAACAVHSVLYLVAAIGRCCSIYQRAIGHWFEMCLCVCWGGGGSLHTKSRCTFRCQRHQIHVLACACCAQVTNPATGQVLATLPKMKSDETLTAIAAAHAVFPQWSNTTAKERGAILRK